MANATHVDLSPARPLPPTDEQVKAMTAVGNKFGDGSQLLVNGEMDEHGLPVAFIAYPEPVKSQDQHPRHPGVIVEGPEVPVVTRVPVSQVLELIRAGVLKKADEKKAA